MPLNPLNDVFVFQPGSTGPTRFDAGTQVYTDWADLYAELTASTAFQKTVVIDDTYVFPSIPAGTYDFAGVRLVGRWSTRSNAEGYVFLTLSSGVVIEDCPWVENFRIGNSLGSGYFNYDSGTNFGLEIRRSLLDSNGGSAPLINVSNTTTLQLYVDRSTIGGNLQNCVYLTATDTLEPTLRGASLIDQNALNAPTGATLSNQDIAPGSKIDPTQAQWVDPLPAFDSASHVVYDPSTPGDWSVAPSDVGAALDDLAAANNSARETVKESFAFNTPSPITVTGLNVGDVVVEVYLRITTAFDGAGPAITVGDTGTADLYMAAGDNDPTTVAVYKTTPMSDTAGATNFTITIQAPGATQGDAVLVALIHRA